MNEHHDFTSMKLALKRADVLAGLLALTRVLFSLATSQTMMAYKGGCTMKRTPVYLVRFRRRQVCRRGLNKNLERRVCRHCLVLLDVASLSLTTPSTKPIVKQD